MKRILILLPLLVLALSCAQGGYDDLPDSIDGNRYRFGVNTNPYEYFRTPETPVPSGFKPFYISHYGRHGSRSDWGGDYPAVLEAFAKAEAAGVLTEQGLTAYRRAVVTDSLHNGMNGRLTARGAREHRQIARRMYNKYRRLFRGNSKVRAVSSISPRCIVSMGAFTGELLSLNPKLDMSWDTGSVFMAYCNSDDPRDVHKESKVILQKYIDDQVLDTASFAERMFTDEAAARECLGTSMKEFMGMLMEMAKVSGAFELDETLLDLFSLEDLKAYGRYISMNLYLRQCNSVEFGDRRMAAPGVEDLLRDLITKADAVISDGGCAADLRFGHDYQLLAFCSRIGLKGIAERLDASQAPDWPGWLYSPFAGNFQMVFYRNRAGEVLVKCFINEREATLLGLEDGPYYRWEDFKAAVSLKE